MAKKKKTVGRPKKRGPKKGWTKKAVDKKAQELLSVRKEQIQQLMESKYTCVGKIVMESGLIDHIEDFMKSKEMIQTRAEINTYKEVLEIL